MIRAKPTSKTTSTPKPGQHASHVDKLAAKMFEQAKTLKANVYDARKFFINKHWKGPDGWIVKPGPTRNPVNNPDLTDALGNLSASLDHWLNIGIRAVLDTTTVGYWKSSSSEYMKKKLDMEQKIKDKRGMQASPYLDGVQQKLDYPIGFLLIQFTEQLHIHR